MNENVERRIGKSTALKRAGETDQKQMIKFLHNLKIWILGYLKNFGGTQKVKPRG